ncbi:ComEA family DNA-binding protein [Bifidobacterium magnum]|uniref:ComEA family DNA-binding protein n=1 Tax=Bifidobacterium magnum TaxID=1692 RepID=UPI00136340C6|nr:helix-hairpin-helix domain-containing protein [Bifidobacterium magnum]
MSHIRTDAPAPPLPPRASKSSGRAGLETLRGDAMRGLMGDGAHTPRRRAPQIGVEPKHALAAILVLVVALAASITLLVQQSINFTAAQASLSVANSSSSSSSSSPSSISPPAADDSPSPSASAAPSAQGEASGSSEARADASPAPVNINTASQEELETIKGVGPVTAANIVAYRASAGPFASVDELVNVAGIGMKTVEKLRPYITVG